MENKQWVSVIGFNEYVTSKEGVVKSLRYNKEKILSTRINYKGYKCVSLRNNNRQKVFKVHRLIAIHFIPNPENKPQVNHKNGIKTDNRIENLEWCTNLENQKHARKNGLINDSGIRNKGAKLKDESIIEIRNSSSQQKDLALKYGVSKSLISRVKLGLAWKHI